MKEVDPNEQLDEDVEDLLMHIADDFIEQTVTSACALARHRKANSIEVKDVQYVLGTSTITYALIASINTSIYFFSRTQLEHVDPRLWSR